MRRRDAKSISARDADLTIATVRDRDVYLLMHRSGSVGLGAPPFANEGMDQI